MRLDVVTPTAVGLLLLTGQSVYCWRRQTHFVNRIPRAGGFFWHSSAVNNDSNISSVNNTLQNYTAVVTRRTITTMFGDPSVTRTQVTVKKANGEVVDVSQDEDLEKVLEGLLNQSIDEPSSEELDKLIEILLERKVIDAASDDIQSEESRALSSTITEPTLHSTSDVVTESDNNSDRSPAHAEAPSDTTSNDAPEVSRKDDTNIDDAPVILKTGKKSNAVGDPDGDGSDDSDDESDLTEEWEDYMADNAMVLDAAQVQMQVEVLNGSSQSMSSSSATPDKNNKDDAGDVRKSSTGGGLRLSNGVHRLTRRKKPVPLSFDSIQTIELQAWTPHVYMPPSTPAIDYLTQHARMWDSAGKVRLDRRTLYAGLLMEWMGLTAAGNFRKFMDPSTLQAFQAALSLATQPQWRKSFPRPNGIRFYEDMESNSGRGGCTLAMQESIAMALVSAGASSCVLTCMS
jgi:hypothetical protein